MTARRGSKGIAWAPVAIALIFLVQFLVFSLFFTKFTSFQREVTSANTVFEGDELATYARSIDNSVELSISHALYGFYLDQSDKEWQKVGSGTGLVPDPVPKIKEGVDEKAQKFLEAHAAFDQKVSGKDYTIGFPGSIGSSSVGFDDARVWAVFEQPIILSKEFENSDFSLPFTPQAELVTVFGKMFRVIRDDLIGKDRIGKYTLEAIGKPFSGGQAEAGKVMCDSPDRDSPTERRQLHSYIDENVKMDAKYAKIATYSRIDQTQTKGSVKYCDTDDWARQECACDDPCKPGDTARDIVEADSGRLYTAEPSDDDVYFATHGQSFGSGQGLITTYGEERLTCLEGELDYATEEYTAAFDGDKQVPGLGPTTRQVKAKIVGSCSVKDIGGECRGYSGKQCGSCGETRKKHIWTCPKVREKICDPFSHYAEGSAEVRFQEDGFVYSLDRLGEPVADNVKIVFKASSGNKDL